MTKFLHPGALLLALLLPFAAHAFWGDDELLPADEAFAIQAEMVGQDRVRVTWDIADDFYMYRSRVQLHSDTDGVTLGDPDFPQGKLKQDETFGEVEVYFDRLSVTAPVERGAGAPEEFVLRAVSQGCMDSRGICYTPHTQKLTLALPAAADSAPGDAAPPTGEQSFGGGGFGMESDLLDVDEAFRLETEVIDGNTLQVHWEIAPGYYLYRDRFSFERLDGEGVALGEADFPAGEMKDDENFGRVEVYHDGVTATVPLERTGSEPTAIRLAVGYQGCAEGRICYTPQTRELDLDLPAAAATVAQLSADDAAGNGGDDAAPVTEQDRIAASLASGNTLLVILTFFGFGLLLAFTPCVFPMIPILSSIIVGQGEDITTRRAFVLSLVYVLAMALTYTVAGVIAGLTGENLQAAFQNPWILGSFAVIFVALSLSMFGFYELQIPNSLQSKLNELSNRQQGGTLTGVAIMGFLSALIVGPCVAAPLAGALIYIGQTGDPWLGGAALFALSMGMGAPLLAIGTGAGKVLPRAGDWMNAIKATFGVLLLAVAIWMLERIIPTAAAMLLWAGLFIISAIYMGATDRLDVDASGWQKLLKGMGVLLLAYGVILLIGVAAGGRDTLQPLRGVALTGGGTTAQAQVQGIEFKTIKSLDDLQREVAAASNQGKSVLLDFYADWCTDCHRMEKNTFSDPQVQQTLANTVTLKADVTANDEIDKELLKHFRIPGPPSLILYDRNGEELRRYRIMGYMGPEEFAAHVGAAFGS
ncbi:protein-disulfide reductase DsbD [Thiohalobacter thiocyanaticus]|uniref:Thiol:disulfide interchange protein DsbD n=1 Tax=Thiohalobacter thiocyanaticus TaxID=585455 RepID=A0A426QIU9_9GAMM|nr:protein-disulfide reductase DsbD [Thiohalobacter thiocyanaticus]RRQ21627.1 protein-disulfide reductase DsbD [Thiohalobacter thiocyanaticus]